MLSGRGVAGWTKGSYKSPRCRFRIPLLHIDRKKIACLCVALRTTAKEVIFMKNLKKQFTDSFQEMRDLKVLVAAAMLLSITVVLGFYRVQLTESIRIGFDFIAKESTSMFFGPVVGCMVAGLSDIISYIIKPVGAFFPGLTLSAMLGSVIYGVILYKRPLSLRRIIVANSTVTVFVNMLLNTYWMTILYGDAFAVLFPARAMKQIIMLPVEIILFYTVAKMFSKANLADMIGRRTLR